MAPKSDGVACDVNDDAAAGEVGDDFVFLGEGGGGRQGQNREEWKEKAHRFSSRCG